MLELRQTEQLLTLNLLEKAWLHRLFGESTDPLLSLTKRDLRKEFDYLSAAELDWLFEAMAEWFDSITIWTTASTAPTKQKLVVREHVLQLALAQHFRAEQKKIASSDKPLDAG